MPVLTVNSRPFKRQIANITRRVFCGSFLESSSLLPEGTNANETQEGWKVEDRLSPGRMMTKDGHSECGFS